MKTERARSVCNGLEGEVEVERCRVPTIGVGPVDVGRSLRRGLASRLATRQPVRLRELSPLVGFLATRGIQKRGSQCLWGVCGRRKACSDVLTMRLELELELEVKWRE